MAIYRVEKTRDYTVMANCHLRDVRLSLKAKGLLSLLLSLPDDWKISLRGIMQFTANSVECIQSGVNELTEAGYITRSEEQTHDEKGRLAGYVYVIHEAPCTEKPYKEKPCKENPHTLNTEILSTSNLPPIAPLEDGKENSEERPLRQPAADTSPCAGEAVCGKKPRRRRTKTAPEWEPEMFERFWKAYPRGEDKAGAAAEWDALKPERETMKIMGAALRRQKQSEDWQRGIGIPYAVRWLRRRRWEDEDKNAAAEVKPPKELPIWK